MITLKIDIPEQSRELDDLARISASVGLAPSELIKRFIEDLSGTTREGEARDREVPEAYICRWLEYEAADCPHSKGKDAEGCSFLRWLAKTGRNPVYYANVAGFTQADEPWEMEPYMKGLKKASEAEFAEIYRQYKAAGGCDLEFEATGDMVKFYNDICGWDL